MLAILITAIITFFISSLFGYVVHKSLHQEWTGRFNKSHMTHHLKLYPPEDYLSDTYRDAGSDNTVKTFAIAAIPLVLIPIALWLVHILTLTTFITCLVVMAVMSFLHSYLHDAFHIRNHWLNSIPIFDIYFQYWADLHYLHHINMQTNFGIFLFHWDKILGTFWEI